jgi:hypothetical protein
LVTLGIERTSTDAIHRFVASAIDVERPRVDLNACIDTRPLQVCETFTVSRSLYESVILIFIGQPQATNKQAF